MRTLCASSHVIFLGSKTAKKGNFIILKLPRLPKAMAAVKSSWYFNCFTLACNVTAT
jgi:hypothetical protein